MKRARRRPAPTPAAELSYELLGLEWGGLLVLGKAT